MTISCQGKHFIAPLHLNTSLFFPHLKELIVQQRISKRKIGTLVQATGFLALPSRPHGNFTTIHKIQRFRHAHQRMRTGRAHLIQRNVAKLIEILESGIKKSSGTHLIRSGRGVINHDLLQSLVGFLPVGAGFSLIKRTVVRHTLLKPGIVKLFFLRNQTALHARIGHSW